MPFLRPGCHASAATLLVCLTLLQGCSATPGSPSDWGVTALALIGAAALGGLLVLAWQARRHKQIDQTPLRRARDEARAWQELHTNWTWRCDAQLQLQRWDGPPPGGAQDPSGDAVIAPPLRLPELFQAVASTAEVPAPLGDTLGRGHRFAGMRVRLRHPASDRQEATHWVLAGMPCYDDNGVWAGYVGSARPTRLDDDRQLAEAGLDGLSAQIPTALAIDDGSGWTLRRVSAALQEQWPSALPGSPLVEWLQTLPAAVLTASGQLRTGQRVETEGWQLSAFELAGGRSGQLLVAPLSSAAASSEFGAEGDSASFNFTVSHDLRAPIRVVDGFARIVKEDYGHLLDRVGNDHLERVLGAAARMNLMIDALMTMARLSSQPLARQPVNLSQLAAYVVDDLTRGAPEREAEIEIEPGLSAQGDPTLLRLVLENLLGNAWKYSARCPRTRISFRRRQGAGGTASFEVCDNGAGFDMRSADRLFGLFQRLHSTNDFPGHGVGLASVKRIVRRHGGDIWAESEPGRGATFIFTLAG